MPGGSLGLDEGYPCGKQDSEVPLATHTTIKSLLLPNVGSITADKARTLVCPTSSRNRAPKIWSTRFGKGNSSTKSEGTCCWQGAYENERAEWHLPPSLQPPHPPTHLPYVPIGAVGPVGEQSTEARWPCCLSTPSWTC